MSDLKLHVTKVGCGKPLVLLHGWGFDGRVWDSLAQELILLGGYEIYQVDLPGFGRSDAMDFMHFKQLLLERLPPQVVLLGWSMGGLYAARLALEAPLRIQRLINVASSPCFLGTTDWPGISMEVLTGFHQRLSTDPARTLNDFINLQLHGTSLSLKIDFIDDLTNKVRAGLLSGLSILIDWDLRAELHALTMPVLYIFGRLDLITPRATMSVMQRKYPNITHKLFTRAAHVPFLSHKDEFMTLLLEWMV